MMSQELTTQWHLRGVVQLECEHPELFGVKTLLFNSQPNPKICWQTRAAWPPLHQVQFRSRLEVSSGKGDIYLLQHPSLHYGATLTSASYLAGGR